jgi:glycerol kinase
MDIIIALDCGTTGNRAIAYDQNAHVIASSYNEFKQYYPKEAWVEHDPLEIIESTREVLKEVIQKYRSSFSTFKIMGIGITNQRETTILWDKNTGKPFYNAVVWQCRRTSEYCKSLKEHHTTIKEKTGLFCDPYFSATKIKWILDTIPEASNAAKQGNCLFGTVDSWILWNLSKEQAHATDHSNASRTMLYNLQSNTYDPDLLTLFSIPESILPEIKDSNSLFGNYECDITGHSVPIIAILGDQQAALFSHNAYRKAAIKNTYGTGIFMMANTQSKLQNPGKLVSTVSWKIDGKISYSLEGSVFMGGATIQWLRDNLNMMSSSDESEALALSVPNSGGVTFVPALTGLGAPYWNPEARGQISGLSRGSTSAHIIRAGLESLAFQSNDLLEAMLLILDEPIPYLSVDGGATQNNFLMQFQADISQLPIHRQANVEATAFGVAILAGMTVGLWSYDTVMSQKKDEEVFRPRISLDSAKEYRNQWGHAVNSCNTLNQRL